MPHVDEGTLHAWLDGALQAEDLDAAVDVERHVAMCADCRARLDEARRLRDDADTILAYADPGEIDSPPFAEIVERTRAEDRVPGGRAGAPIDGRPARRRRRLHVPLAWAASIAIAVTAGWWARELASPAGELAATRTTGSSPTESAQADAPDPPPPPPSPAARVDAADDAARRERLAPDTRADAAGDLARSERATPAARADDSAERPAPRPAPTEVAAADRSVDEPITIAPTTFDEEPIIGLPDPPAASLLAADAAGAGVAANARGWRPATHAEAERWVGGPIFVLPDAPIVDFALGGTGAEPAVRTRQRLADGTVLGWIQRPSPRAEAPLAPLLRSRTDAAAPARALAEAPAAVSTTAAPALTDAADTSTAALPMLDVAGFRLTPQASLPADSLRSLLRRARPYERPRGGSLRP